MNTGDLHIASHLEATKVAASSCRELGQKAWLGLFDVKLLDPGLALDGFSLEGWSTGRFVVARAVGRKATLVRDQEAMRLCHLDACALISIDVDPTVHAGGNTHRAPPEIHLSIFDFAKEVTVPLGLEDADARFRLAAIWFPRSIIAREWGKDSEAPHRSIAGGSTAAHVVSQALRTFAARAESSTSAEINLISDAIVSLALSAFRPVQAMSGATTPLETVDAVRRFIDRNLGSPRLSPDMIASNFGLSRSTLYRLFEPLGGIAGYIRARRMQRVYAEITSPARANRRIGPAAFAVGFKNFSAFSRAFRETYGVTPAEARRNAIAGAAPTGDASNTGEISTLCRWVRDLRP